MEVQDRRGETALTLAAKRGASAVAQLLVAAGADPCRAAATLAEVHSQAASAALRFLVDPQLLASAPSPLHTAFALAGLWDGLAGRHRERSAEFSALRRACEAGAGSLLDQCQDLWEARRMLCRSAAVLDAAAAHGIKSILARHDTQRVCIERWRGCAVDAPAARTAAMVAFYLCGWLVLPVLAGLYVRRRRGFRYSLLGRYWELAHTPFFKFVGRAASFVAFLALVVAVTVQPSQPVPSGAEIAAAVWVCGLLLEEAAEWRALPAGAYLASPWNWIDLLMLAVFTVVIVVRALVWTGAAAVSGLFAANVLLAVGTVVACVRLLHVFQANMHLGPLLVRRCAACAAHRRGSSLSCARSSCCCASCWCWPCCCSPLRSASPRQRPPLARHVSRAAAVPADRCPRAVLAHPGRCAALLPHLQRRQRPARVCGLRPARRRRVRHRPGHVCAVSGARRAAAARAHAPQTFVVLLLLNLLIAAFSQTYVAVQDNLDTEWKFLRAKLLLQFEQCSCWPAHPPCRPSRATGTPAPLNLLVEPLLLALRCWGVDVGPEASTVDPAQRAEDHAQLRRLYRKLGDRRQAGLDLHALQEGLGHGGMLAQLLRDVTDLRAELASRCPLPST